MRLDRIAKFLSLAFLLFFIASCGEDSRYIPNVENIPDDLQIIRFDQAFAKFDTTDAAGSIKKLEEQHPDFSNLFLGDILGGNIIQDIEGNTSAFWAQNDSFYRKLCDTINIVYPDMKQQEESLKKIFQFYRYYFPQDSTPLNKIYTYASIYRYGMVVMDDYVAVGLDFFLGEDHIDYQYVGNLRHAYIRRTLTPEHLPANLANAIATDFIEQTVPSPTPKLINEMIYNGKVFYVTDLLAPHLEDSVKFKFSDYQMRYCLEGEAALYDHLVKDVDLYSDKRQDYRKYIEIGPFNPDNGLNGNSASWLGTQIVMQYAEAVRADLKRSMGSKDPQKLDIEVMRQVLAQESPQEFLKKYKPKN